MTETIVRAVCPHDCPDQCSMLVRVDGDRVLGVAGDPAHPLTAGWLCAKVSRYEERVHSPERLTTPLRRTGPKGSGELQAISWDAALDEIAERWRRVISDCGGEALLGYAYSGHMGLVNRNAYHALFHALGASRLVAGTVCDSTSEAGWHQALGDTPGTDPETIVDSDLVVAWGANLATTNVHLLPLIDRAREKGAQLVVIDPQRTRTARRADWHLAPRVGTDTALALGVMHVIVRDGLHDAAQVERRSVGFDRLVRDVLPRYAPERVAEITGLAAADVERLGRLYGTARAPFIRLGMGMSRHSGGGMAIRTVAYLPTLVGAWEKPGGGALLDTVGIWGFDYTAIRRPDLAPRETRRIRHHQIGRALTELTDPPLMALFVASNNPAVTCPDSGRVEAGLRREELFTVVHDLFLTDTARFADIVLPATTALETEDVFRSYGSYYVQHSPRAIAPQGEARSNLWVAQELARRMGLTDEVFGRDARAHLTAALATATGPTAELTFDGLVGAGPVRLPWVSRGPATTHFYSDEMAAQGLPGLPEWQADGMDDGQWPLRLLTAPGHFQHHTAFDGVERLQRREGEPSCTLHPDDAATRGIADGDPVELWNGNGHVGLRARVSEDGQPGVVVVSNQRNRARYLSGGPLNVLVGDAMTDLGEGAVYQSTYLDVRRLAPA